MKKLYNYNAHITNVVDGDTVDATVDLGFNVQLKLRIRLAGINTPELKDKDLAIRAKAVAAKEALAGKILNRNIMLDSKGQDKYGRWVGDIHLNDVYINDQMKFEGYAVAYMEQGKIDK